MADIRPSPIAGRWYPGRPAQLRAEMERYLAEAGERAPGAKLHAIVVPHAGYQYSGRVAAHAFNWLRELRPPLIAVVSPLHSWHPAPALTTAHAAYATPLGSVPVDRDSVQQLDRALAGCLEGGLFPLAYDSEHAVEIELPFLQHLVGDFRLIPVMLREQSWETARAVGEALAAVLAEKDAVLVASSDLSHFYPQPVARQLDAEILRLIQTLDPEGIIKADESGTGLACGRGAIAAVLCAALRRGANRAQVVQYATSGDVTGEYDRVVGYGAAVIFEDIA